MNIMSSSPGGRDFTAPRAAGTGLVLLATAAAVVACLLFFDQLALVALAIVAVCCGLAFLRWPDLTTLAAIGLIYSNLPVVAVRFHGAPAFLPAAALGLFAWPFVYRIVCRQETVRFLSAAPYVLAFAGVQLLGALNARDPDIAFANFISFLLEGAAVYFLVTNLIRTRRQALAVFGVLAACAILMGGFPLLKQVVGDAETTFGGLAQTDSEFRAAEDAVVGVVRQQRASGTIGEQNRYAQFMILLAPIGICLFSISRSQAARWFALTATLAALLGFALAFSRGAAVGLVLAFLIAIWLKMVDRKQIKLVLLGAGLVLLILPQYATRLASLGSLVGAGSQSTAGLGAADGAIRGRLTEMGAALLAFRDRPLVGVGPGMFGQHSQQYGQIIGLRSLGAGRQAHSMPLDIAAEHGILGLLAIVAALTVVLASLLRGRRAARASGDTVGAHFSSGIALALILYLTTGLFLHLSYIRYFWLLIALADAVGRIVADTRPADDYLPDVLRDPTA